MTGCRVLTIHIPESYLVNAEKANPDFSRQISDDQFCGMLEDAICLKMEIKPASHKPSPRRQSSITRKYGKGTGKCWGCGVDIPIEHDFCDKCAESKPAAATDYLRNTYGDSK